MSWSYLLWTVTIQLLTTLSRLGHTALRALSHYGPHFRAKWQSYSFLLYLKLYLSGMSIQKLQSTSLPVRNENITYHINKQEMSQPLAILASKCDWGLPKLWFSKCCQPLQGDCWGAGGMQEARWVRNQGWPLIACERNEFQWAQRLASSHAQNGKFLNWYLIFGVQNSCFFCCRLVHSLTSPPSSLEQFSQSYWNTISWAQSPKHSHQIK